MVEKYITHWVTTPVGGIADLLRGITYKKEQASKMPKIGYKPVLRANNINGALNFDNLVYVPEQNISEQQLLKTGDIVFAMSSGSKHLVGKSAQSKSDFDGSYGAFCAVLRPCKLVSKDYVYYIFQGNNFRRLISEVAKGSNINNLKREHILDFEISLPPIDEQHRIVAKIEELFSELDKGIENLKTAQAQLKVYRQALLKHAFEGKLTANWRASKAVIPAKAGIHASQKLDPRLRGGDDMGGGGDVMGSGGDEPLETADALLGRIQQERVERYRQQLDKWEKSKSPSIPLSQRGKTNSATSIPPLEKGGTGGISVGGARMAKPKAPKTLPPLTSEELGDLPELPEGWGWVKFGQVFNIFVGSTPSRKRADFWNGDISWVSSGEVAFCRIKATKERITNIGYESASTEIHPVGTVMLAMIGEGKTRGQAAILDIEAAHNQNTAAIRVSESGCSTSFVYQYLVYRYEITRKIGSGNNQKALNKERVSDLVLPLCSIAEMDEVSRCIDEKLSEVDQLDQTITTSLQQSEALRQSILKKAFSGQLVPQDPKDEPASELLARIKAERATVAVKPRKNSTGNRVLPVGIVPLALVNKES